MKGLDVSFGAPGVTPEWAAARLAEGYRVLVVGLWSGAAVFPGAERALRTWREAGGIAAGYLVVHDYRPVSAHLAGAAEAAGDEWGRLAFVAIDVERVTDGPLPGQVTAQTIDDATTILSVDGLRSVIYTAQGMWTGILGQNADFASYPLWDARYQANPSLDAGPGYGGWTARMGHQWAENVLLDGVKVDLNEFNDAFFGTGEPEEDMRTLVDILNEQYATLATAAGEADAAGQRDVATLIRRAMGVLPDEQNPPTGIVAVKKLLGLQ